MTLKDAFKEWAHKSPKLSAGYRSEFKHVFLSEHGKDDVRQFTEFYVRQLMGKNKSIAYVKTRALACLVYVLEWAHKEGFCQKPEFNAQSLMIAIDETTDKGEDEHVNEVASDNGDTAAKPAASPSAVPKGNHGGPRKRMPISALHPETLTVVRTFESQQQAAKELGGCNSNYRRALEKGIISHGYYWCRTGEEKDFKPTSKRRRKAKKNNKALGREMPVLEERDGLMHQTENDAPTTQTSLSDFSDVELRAELERRGWYGTLYQRMEFMAARDSVPKHKTI